MSAELGAGPAEGFESCPSVVDYLLLKVAARCNIACSYCYWFRDQSVMSKPKVISAKTLSVLVDRLETHVKRYGLQRFSILLHGGEPLLCKKHVLVAFFDRLEILTRDTGCSFELRLTTNGLLLDLEWIAILRRYAVGVTISVDGPKHLHDASRIDFQGQGTFDKVLSAIALLRSESIEPGILAVCHPESTPDELVRFFVDDLNLDGFDVLIPDATHEDGARPIAPYYSRLIDLWFDELDAQGVRVRIIDNMLLGLFGGFSESESIGYGPIRRLTVLSDGSMETLDVLRIIEPSFTASALNIHKDQIQDIENDPLWQEVLEASVTLPLKCSQCKYKYACGGGHIATRWSDLNRFNNPSVYCGDIQEILNHAWKRVQPSLFLASVVEAPAGTLAAAAR